MAKNAKFSTGFANALLNSDIRTIFDSGRMDIYDGTQPANANAAVPAVNKLATVDLPADAFGTEAGGILSLVGTWTEAAAILNGTATWFRLRASGDTDAQSTTAIRIDGTVGITAGQFDLVLTSAQIKAGDPVDIDTFDIVIPTT